MAETSLTRLTLAEAVWLAIETEIRTPLITQYQLGILVYRIQKMGGYDGHPLRGHARPAHRADLNRARNPLFARGLMTTEPGVPNTVARIRPKSSADPTELLCAIDPFAFISHLSAMAHHGLTDRLPKLLFFTSLAGVQWTRAARDQMLKDLGEDFSNYQSSGLPLMRRIKLSRLGRQPLNAVLTQHAGGYRLTREGLVKVSTMGRTFLDMLRRSDLCGGMPHIIEVFKQHAKRNLQAIVTDLELHGAPIDKVRAGFLLETYCDVKNPKIDSWIQYAQRGGSRRLDPHAEYRPIFSERWMLSINVDNYD